jgi:cytochrome c peroxidase
LKKKILLFIPALILLKIAVREQSPISDSGIRMGHYLFYDRDLSHHGNTSCASCHDPRFGFTDMYRKSFNAYGDQLSSNSSSLLNTRYYRYWSWRDTTVQSLFSQMERPLFSHNPLEMGFQLDSNKILSRLQSKYRDMISDYCNDAWSSYCLRKALVAYLSVLESRNSDYDHWLNQETCDQWSASFEKGIHIFFDKQCHNCHGGLDLNDREGGGSGYYAVRPPSLRNVAITKPYFVDGRTAVLREALLNHPENIWLADSSRKLKIETPAGQEIEDLLTFLYGLTDTSYLDNPLYLAPNEN